MRMKVGAAFPLIRSLLYQNFLPWIHQNRTDKPYSVPTYRIRVSKRLREAQLSASANISRNSWFQPRSRPEKIRLCRF
ncbi:hypothetical protein XENOCAPTIV_026916 [Xenoophorus captivus]|uniref:Uncharacterized protein n=1 Tax=Xenoophorus captivus TaxID=1517983 RepID=A0ABV0QK55_9TELE